MTSCEAKATMTDDVREGGEDVRSVHCAVKAVEE